MVNWFYSQVGGGGGGGADPVQYVVHSVVK